MDLLEKLKFYANHVKLVFNVHQETPNEGHTVTLKINSVETTILK